MKQHTTMKDALEQIEADFKQITTGKFMSAIWYLDEDGRMHCKRTTWQFPVDRLWECHQLLDSSLISNQEPDPDPLPLAPFLSVVRDDDEHTVDESSPRQTEEEVNGEENL